MKILFWGNACSNSGPGNVNKGMIMHLTDTFYAPDSNNKYFPSFSELKKLWNSDVVVVSGLHRRGYIMELLAKLLGKKLVFILHGYYAYEVKVNEFKRAGAGVVHERFLLWAADLILPVSQKYQLWMQQQCPQYANKMNYLFNGLDKDALRKIDAQKKIPGSVAATGGIRKQKKNDVLTKVAEELNGKIELTVYGAVYNGLPPVGLQHTQYTGVIPHGSFLERLSQTEIFVVNSILESFSVAAIEALFCGCGILISDVAGVTDLLDLEECDVIHNPDDESEIRNKILYLQEHPNNERIMATFDLEQYGFDKSVDRLENLCRKLITHT